MTEEAIRQLGFDPKDIKLLLVGHAHSDHAGATAYFKKLSGAQIAIIDEEKDLFESGGKLDFHYGKYKEFEFEPAKVDWVFRDGDILKLGDIAITALLTNGLSVNPGYRVAKDPSYAGIGENFRRTLHILEMIKPDIWLFPHTETYNFEQKLARSKTEGIKAWIDPEGYRVWLVAQRENFEATVNEELGVPAKPK